MSPDEINSFMRRLVDNYVAIDEVEVEEERDTVLIFEHSKISSIKTNSKNKILAYLDQLIQKHDGHKNHSILYVLNAVKEYYIRSESLAPPKIKDIIESYVKLAIDTADVRKINVELKTDFYTYRKNKTRLGIAIDKTIIPAGKRAKAGFGRNFKMDIRFAGIKVVEGEWIDLVSFASSVWWSSKNAAKHGYDDRTGIIWFDGEADGNKWIFPNALEIIAGDPIKIDAVIITDAFSKMFKRLELDKKIHTIIK